MVKYKIVLNSMMNDDGTMPTIFEHDGVKEIISMQQLHEWVKSGNEDICIKCSHINCVCRLMDNACDCGNDNGVCNG